MTGSGYAYGDAVRLLRNVRNDGSYPGAARGELLVRRGSVGYVRDRGRFLQDQVIYAIYLPGSGRVVGCREQELQPAAAPWVASTFEQRDPVRTTAHLAVAGQRVVAAGTCGEVLRVHRQALGAVVYEVCFPGPRVLLVPERSLEEAGEPVA